MAAIWTQESRATPRSTSGIWECNICLPGQIVIAADYSANRSTHLPWAGASVSTRERNFLPSSIRNALVADH